MGAEKQFRVVRPASANEPGEAAFHDQDEWRKSEFRRVVGGGGDDVSVDQGEESGVVGTAHSPEPSRGGLTEHSRAVGLATTINPVRSVFTADVAAVLIAIAIVVLILVALLSYTPSARRPEPNGNPQTIVWVDKQTGLYFCPGTKLYGKGKGEYMTQRAARLQSHRPAFHSECD